jgi:hypothetical protein
MRGVCGRMSPVKAKVIAVVGATDVVVGVVETTVVDDVALEVVAVQPVVMQANTNVNRPSLT